MLRAVYMKKTTTKAPRLTTIGTSKTQENKEENPNTKFEIRLPLLLPSTPAPTSIALQPSSSLNPRLPPTAAAECKEEERRGNKSKSGTQGKQEARKQISFSFLHPPSADSQEPKGAAAAAAVPVATAAA